MEKKMRVGSFLRGWGGMLFKAVNLKRGHFGVERKKIACSSLAFCYLPAM